MVRASAKNHQHVLIATNPSPTATFFRGPQRRGTHQDVDMQLRQALALEAFEHTAAYDVAISQELHRRVVGDPASFSSMEEQRDRLPACLLPAIE